MKHKIINLSLASFCSLILSGCITAALAGLAGGGAYYAGKAVANRNDQKVQTESLIQIKEELEQKQKQLTARDTGIGNEINSRLVSGSVAPNMAVYPEVKNGVVILHGRVPDPQTAERVIASTRSTPGVQRIISNLVVVNQQGLVNPAAARQIPNNLRTQQQQIQQQMGRQPQPVQVLPNQLAPPPQQQRYVPQQFQQQYVPPQSFNNRGNTPNLNNTARKYSGGVKKKPAYQNFSEDKDDDEDDDNDNIRRPANSSKVMDDKTLQQFQQQYQDNDSAYVKYNPSYIAPPAPSQPTPVVSNPYIVNVETPTTYVDNDSAYIPYTGYRAPVTSTYGGGNIDVNIPTPSTYQDNDANYELYHYY